MMMGGLHIEIAIQNMIGKWLTGSGWTDMFLKAEVATSGRCESLLKSSHVKKNAVCTRSKSVVTIHSPELRLYRRC